MANKKMQEAKEAGEKYTEDFRGYEIFIKTYFAFEFMAEHNLVGNSQAVFKDFKNYVEKQLRVSHRKKQAGHICEAQINTQNQSVLRTLNSML